MQIPTVGNQRKFTSDEPSPRATNTNTIGNQRDFALLVQIPLVIKETLRY